VSSARTAERLARNLRALEPKLAERLSWPVASEHVDPGPPARYLHQRAWVPLGLAELGDPTEDLARAAGARGEVLVIGAGVGELLERVLHAAPEARITLYERDPWLLRLALGKVDASAALAEGRLRLALGTDLLDHAVAGAVRVHHPLLARLYARDVRLAERGAGRRAALCTGGLLVESLAQALERAGFGVWPLAIQGLALAELDHQMARLAPELLLAVNYTNGLAELAGRHAARLVVWEIDPTTTAPRLERTAPGARAAAHVFTWRARGAQAFRDAGFEHVRHLPLAADVELRRPLELGAAERERYGAPLAFVGASLVQNAARQRERFRVCWARTGRARAGGEELVEGVLAEQRRDFSRYRLPEIVAERAPELLAATAEPGGEDPLLLLAELAAAEKRLSYVASLGRLGIHVWGDAGWRVLEPHGVRVRGPAGNGPELTRIYNATRVNVDVGRLYQNDIVTLRTFDALASGAFLLVEHTDELERLFEVGAEVESYRTLPELLAKARRYLEDPAAAAAIAARGLSAVRERHTVDLRLATMLEAAPPVEK
jgi:hypothetical protein